MPNAFNGVKVFSATMYMDRERLGEQVTEWLRTNPVDVVDVVVSQSSDSRFHCIVITIFYNPTKAQVVVTQPTHVRKVASK